MKKILLLIQIAFLTIVSNEGNAQNREEGKLHIIISVLIPTTLIK